MNRIPQKDDIWNIIETRGYITDEIARKEVGCSRVSARIYDLRKEGKKIKTDMIAVPTRRGKTYVACYKKAVSA